MTKFEFKILRTLSCKVSKSCNLDFIGSISDAFKIISVEPTSSANCCCVVLGDSSALIWSNRFFANLWANAGNVSSASCLYWLKSLNPFDLNKPCLMICFPGLVPIKAPLLKIDSSFPLTNTILCVVIYAFKKKFFT